MLIIKTMATKIISFIDTNYIKTNSPMSKHIDDEVIAPILIQAQEKWVLPVLGSHLYNDLQDKMEAYIDSNTAISTAYTTLINDYIKPLQMHYSTYELIPFLNFKMTNVSIAKKSSEFSQPSSIEEMNYLRNSVKATAQFYSDRMVSYLQAHTTTYPKYLEGVTSLDDIYPEQSETFCGIYLGKNKRGYCI
jgi:hypothetical protein